MEKATRRCYTLEYKQEAVRLVISGQRVASAAKALGIVEQTLANWVKADKLGQLRGLSSEHLSAERMENIRLRAELARVTMERDILHPTDEDLSAGTPVWVSALSKKSFSSVNSPILACSAFTSMTACSARASPKTPVAPSNNCAFHCVIWLGCTSNCSAYSASVLSPFTADKATFAFNAAE